MKDDKFLLEVDFIEDNHTLDADFLDDNCNIEVQSEFLDVLAPTAYVTKEGTVSTLVVTDRKGTTVTEILDGESGKGVIPGGTTGQALVKKSNTDYDTEWSNVATPGYVDAKIAVHNASEGTSEEPVHPYLQGLISDEATTRAQADATEKSAREAADTTLQANITAEAGARAQADTTLQTNINTEASTRGAKDTELETSINNEVLRATEEEATLQSNIEAEASTARTAEQTLTQNLSGEITRAQGAESTLDSKINTETDNREAADAEITDALTEHKNDDKNPHKVDKSQVGLGNVDNKSEATIKSDFTGSIASGNTGFTLGGAVYTALAGKQDNLPTTVNDRYLHTNASTGALEWSEAGKVDDVTLNGTSVVDNKVAKLTTIDNVTSAGNQNPLTANQGKLLSDRISNLETLGRFLSVWNCTTGLPETEPGVSPYLYKTGDYYRIGQVGTTNYKPNGDRYITGTPSTTVETGTVHSGDIYYYDSAVWTLMPTHSGDFVSEVKVNGTSVVSSGVANINAIPASIVTGQLTDSQISSATTWSSKQDAITSTSKLSSDLVDDSNKTNKFVTEADKTNWNNKVTKNADITGATKTKITYDSKGLVTAGADLTASDIPSLDASKITTGTFADARIASATTWNNKQNAITSSNKLSSDLVDDTNHTNKFVTASEKTSIGTALQPNDNISELVNDAGYLTQHQTLSDLGITATATELNYTDGVTSNIQTQLNGKQPSGSYVTTNTEQTITEKKTILITEPIIRGGQTTALNVLSTHTSEEMDSMWAGRMKIGNKNKTFLLGVYKQDIMGQPAICGIGAHSWEDSEMETGAAWEDIYLNPDGNKAVYIGSHDWRADTGWFKVQNTGNDYDGKAYCNRGSITYPDWHEVATIYDDSAYSENETWSSNKLTTQFGYKENISNKVTTISSTSTNTQYPSAKAVYDKVETKSQVIWRTY